MKKTICTTCGESPCRCEAMRQLVDGKPEQMLRLRGFTHPQETKAASRMKIGGVRRGSRRS